MAQTSEEWRKRAVALPVEFRRYHEIGGALMFAAFDNAEGDIGSALSAIGNVIPGTKVDRLRALGARAISDKIFFGDWYDSASGDLLRLGSITTEDGRSLVNPRLRDLEGIAISNAAISLPEIGAGGQFAYAFSWTPYGLNAKRGEVQNLFSAIREFVLPAGREHQILDWSNPKLADVSQYFEAGSEWWGVFLFTVYTPSNRRLMVIAGSTTD